MTQGINTNLQTILSQARSTCSNIFSSGGSAAGSSQYANSIFSLINEGEQAINGGDQQRAQAITNMVKNLMSMLSGLSNEKAKAKQDVEKNSKKIENNTKKAEQTAEETKNKASEALSSIDGNNANIQGALDDLRALAGDDGNGGELAAQKEKLQKALDEIEEQKRIINDGVSSIDAKNAALAKVKSLSGEIDGLVSSITDIQKSIDSLNSVINENSKSIEDAGAEAAQVVENGAEKLQNNMQQAAQQVTENTADSVKGSTEEVLGADLVSKGSAGSVIPVIGQTASAKAIQLGTDLIAAGSTRISGASTNIGQISTALGKMSADAGEFKGALGNVVGSMTQANNLIGQYGTVLEPTIKAVGSWSQVADANASLDKEIKNAEAKLNGENNTQQQSQQNSTPWQQNSSQSTQQNSSLQQTNSQNASGSGGEQNGNEIFNFDRKQFGV